MIKVIKILNFLTGFLNGEPVKRHAQIRSIKKKVKNIILDIASDRYKEDQLKSKFCIT